MKLIRVIRKYPKCYKFGRKFVLKDFKWFKRFWNLNELKNNNIIIK